MTTTGKINTIDLVYTAIGAALIAVCSFISIPTTVPFTMQTFAVFLVLLTLGGRRGTTSVFLYVLMGAVGIPVFSGFKGSFGVLLGNTGGYILGFILMGLIYALMTKLFGSRPVVEVISLIIGLSVCYAFGTAWFMTVYMRETGSVGVLSVLSWCVFPFIIPDLIKMSMAFFISKRLKPVTGDERH